MAGQREKSEDIVQHLRQVEVLQGQGRSVSMAMRQIGVTVQSYYRWRKDYGGMNCDQLKRLKELEIENTRLKRVVADLPLDKLILSEAARGTEGPRRETSKPFSPSSMHRSCAAGFGLIGAQDPPRIGSASINTTQDALRTARRRTSDRGHHCTDRRVLALWKPHDCRDAEHQGMACKPSARGPNLAT